MATKLAVTVSDLHLGKGNSQDDFGGESAFPFFCREIAAYAKAKNLELTFVLNGDIFELWEIVPDDAEFESAQVIRANLHYPAKTADQKAAATAYGMRQIDVMLDAHPGFVSGLSHFVAVLGDRVQFYYLFGNHDHRMVNEALQQHLRTELTRRSGTPIGEVGRFHFDHYLLLPQLHSYFEHGNQFATGESRYPDPTDPFYEAPGYHFLKYVWNRLQAKHEYSDSLVNQIKIALLLLFPPDGTTPDEVKYIYEYFEAYRDKAFPDLVEGPGKVVRKMYDKWKEKHPLTSDPATDRDLREELRNTNEKPRKAARPAVDRGMANSALGMVPSGLPGKSMILDVNGGTDEYWTGAGKRFGTDQKPPFTRLEHGTVLSVFLGHTHRAKYIYLRNVPGTQEATRYLNTGSWTNAGALVYGWALDEGTGNHSRGLKFYV
jgi:UDP-2,3-diacylglucosamine pyrophosphatase LpxH